MTDEQLEELKQVAKKREQNPAYGNGPFETGFVSGVATACNAVKDYLDNREPKREELLMIIDSLEKAFFMNELRTLNYE